jgi:hypothetical protein
MSGRPRGFALGKSPLLGDKDSKPTEQGVGSDDGSDLCKATPADESGFASKPDSLGVSEATGLAAELFEENTVYPEKLRQCAPVRTIENRK